MSMRTCTLRSLRRCPGQGCAPSFGAAVTALVPLQPAGGALCTDTRELRLCQGRGKCALLLQRWAGQLHLRGL
eukprot:10540905-Alexandrium_andersonii.AAC.1